MIEKRDIIIEEPDEDRQGWNMSGRSVSNGLKGYFSFFRDLRNRLHNSELIPKFSYRFRFYGSDHKCEGHRHSPGGLHGHS